MPPNPAKEAMKAAKNGDVSRLSELLAEQPALLQLTEDDGSTLLHAAAWKGQSEVVRLLLERGADIHAQSTNGHYGGTALHAAAHGDQRGVVQLLIERGADVNAVSSNGRTPLQETSLHNAKAAARLLLQAGAAA